MCKNANDLFLSSKTYDNFVTRTPNDDRRRHKVAVELKTAFLKREKTRKLFICAFKISGLIACHSHIPCLDAHALFVERKA